jgi:hypothetical protein
MFNQNHDDWDSDSDEEGIPATVAALTPPQTSTRSSPATVASAALRGGIALPAARNARVKTAEFVKSSVKVEDCPGTGYPEFAVIGRSNVGKSSLINLITGRHSLALVSKTPGKTRCINHFVINNSW